jgi:F0F1-type ATP synthase membrane subunit b/b'
VVYPYINFAIFIGVLLYFARAPLREMIKSRRDEYEALLAKAQEAQRLATAQFAELQNRLAGLDRELATIREKMKNEASHEAEEIKRKGEELRVYIQGEAGRIRQAEVKHAEEQLQTQIIHLVQTNLKKEIAAQWHEKEQRTFIQQQAHDLSKIVS